MSIVSEHKFDSLEEMLAHLRNAVAEAEAAEAAQAEEIELDDSEVRRQIIKYVVEKIDFNSPEQLHGYLNVIYDFIDAAE